MYLSGRVRSHKMSDSLCCVPPDAHDPYFRFPAWAHSYHGSQEFTSAETADFRNILQGLGEELFLRS